MDRAQLADFLRTRREALHPEDVGLPRGQRRRTGGLRREEVAVLCQMSTDYYSRLEQQRGPRPSEQMLNAIARGMSTAAVKPLSKSGRLSMSWGILKESSDKLACFPPLAAHVFTYIETPRCDKTVAGSSATVAATV